MPTRDHLRSKAFERGAEAGDVHTFDFQALADVFHEEETLVYFGLADYQGGTYRCISTSIRILLYAPDNALLYQWVYKECYDSKLDEAHGKLSASFMSYGERITLYLHPTKPRELRNIVEQQYG